MKTYRYRLSFTTPAFLGNASQQAQWRTPPVKALLRQWGAMAELGFSLDRRRQRESQILGTVTDGEGELRQSQVRIQLGLWNEGRLKDWTGTGKHA